MSAKVKELTAAQRIIAAVANLVKQEALDQVLTQIGTMPEDEIVDHLVQMGEMSRSLLGLAAKYELEQIANGKLETGFDRYQNLEKLVEYVIAAEKAAGTAHQG